MPRKKKAIEPGKEVAAVEKFVRPTKADLFVDAYIRNRFNGTAAALEVFDVEGDEAARKNCAGSIAYEYLQKLDVQQKLRDRMSRTDISVEYVLRRLKELDTKTDNPDISLRVLDRLAHFVGAPIKEASTDVSNRRNSQLNLYLGLPKTDDKRLAEAIDVT